MGISAFGEDSCAVFPGAGSESGEVAVAGSDETGERFGGDAVGDAG